MPDDEQRPDDDAPAGEREPKRDDKAPKGAGGEPPKDKKKDSRRTGILIALTAAGVLLAYLTFRKGGSSSSGTAPGTGSSANNLANYPAGYGVGTSGYVAGANPGLDAQSGFAEMLSNMSSQIQAIQTGLANLTPGTPAGGGSPTGSTTSGSSAPPHSFQYQSGLAYVRNSITGEIDQIESDGTRVWVNPDQWKWVNAQGTPNISGYAGPAGPVGVGSPVQQGQTLPPPRPVMRPNK